MRGTTWLKRPVFGIVAGLGLLGCIGEAPQDPVQVFVPFVSILHQPTEAIDLFDYVDGELTGFTVYFDDPDLVAHGLPTDLPFVGGGGAPATLRAEMSAYVPGGKQIPEHFDCFGPIEIRDSSGEPTVTIDNFCPAGDTPSLTIVGDISAGGDPRWVFDSPAGRVMTNFE